MEGEASLGPSPFGGSETFSKNYPQLGPDGEPIETDLNNPGGAKAVNNDGEWIVLQDWSTCTLACGGGTQTLHRKCRPPATPEGAPCVGEPILTRQCNTQACPPDAEDEVEEEEEPADLKIKIMRVSHRPQRYETCIIKEGDLDVVRDDLTQFQRPPRVPTRVVLNNMTFTVFQTDSYDDVLFSTSLESIGVQAYDQDENCFTAFDGRVGKSITLCSLETLTGISLKENRNEWVKEIGFFKEDCHKDL